jgi:hypothetical protein
MKTSNSFSSTEFKMLFEAYKKQTQKTKQMSTGCETLFRMWPSPGVAQFEVQNVVSQPPLRSENLDSRAPL